MVYNDYFDEEFERSSDDEDFIDEEYEELIDNLFDESKNKRRSLPKEINKLNWSKRDMDDYFNSI